ncbi:MAG: regulatory protein RecX [Acetobacteraceae bacterium]|nr:regulatory protein RecX [Acetobacteraceae bacterium]
MAQPNDDKSPPEPQAARAAAVALLARRDWGTVKLCERLEEKGFDTETVRRVLGELAAEGIVNDARFAQNRVAYQAERGHGPQRIRAQLRTLGLPPEVIDEALQSGPDWHALARSARARKFGPQVPQAWALKARQARFLQYRGFSADHIRSALGPDLDSETAP